MKKIKTGCLFGSFNPVHYGHLMVAQYMATRADLDEVVLIVSPQNPLKDPSELAAEEHRLAMTRLAVKDNPLLTVDDVEFDLPKPSYTIDTLDALTGQYPERAFSLIMGSDNLANFEEWKSWEALIEEYGVHVYRRPGYDLTALVERDGMKVYDAPLINVSSTYIRDCIKKGYSTRYLLQQDILNYIQKHRLYDVEVR